MSRLRNDRGTSLIETSVVLVLMSVVLTSVAVTLRTTWLAEAKLRQSLERDMRFHQISTVFRDDLHAASKVEAADNTLRVVRGSDEVQYTSDGERMERRVTSATNPNAWHADTFLLEPGTTVTYQVLPEDSLPLAMLVIRDRQDQLVRRIQVHIGREKQITTPGASP